jgi:hypothetical protein
MLVISVRIASWGQDVYDVVAESWAWIRRKREQRASAEFPSSDTLLAVTAGDVAAASSRHNRGEAGAKMEI